MDFGRHGSDILRCLAAVVLVRLGGAREQQNADEEEEPAPEADADDWPGLLGKGRVSIEESLSASG